MINIKHINYSSMTVYTIDFIVGFIVTVVEYFDAQGQSFDPTEEGIEEFKKTFSDMEFSPEGYKAEAQENFLANIDEEKLPITPDQKSEILTLRRVTHDIDERCSLAIGIHLGCVYARERYYGTNVTNIHSMMQILKARERLQIELDRIEEINPKLYALLKGKDIQVIMVQNDCKCCS